MARVHQRGQVPRTGLVGDRIEQVPGVTAVVDDAQHLLALTELVGQRSVVERTDVARLDAP